MSSITTLLEVYFQFLVDILPFHYTGAHILGKHICAVAVSILVSITFAGKRCCTFGIFSSSIQQLHVCSYHVLFFCAYLSTLLSNDVLSEQEAVFPVSDTNGSLG